MKPRIMTLGDSALIIQFSEQLDRSVNMLVHAVDAAMRTSAPAGVLESVPANASITVYYDPLVTDFAAVSAWAHHAADGPAVGTLPQGRLIEIPVCYGGEHGPDLAAVANTCRLTPRQVAEMHASTEYTVYMMGFTPGMGYLGELDARLRMPRLATPRTQVPAGSVAIAGLQTVIYPVTSPGGWNLLGRTATQLFESQAERPFLLSPHDRVRFIIESIDA